MRRLVILALAIASGLAFAQSSPVVKPRGKVSDYAAVKHQRGFAVGVAQLSPEQVRKSFVSNISKDYVVVEVGVFPKQETKILPDDFVLREQHGNFSARTENPKSMAAAVNQKDQQGHDVAVYPVAGIEYSSGGLPYDPYDRGGWKTTSGVMVGIGDKKKDAKTNDGDLKAMMAELSEKALPETTTAKPVAGFLYFHVPNRKNGRVQYELEFPGTDGTVVISLPAATK